MYYRVNEDNEIIDIAPGYFPGYHADLEPNLDKASDEQKAMYAIPEEELVELEGNIPPELFSENGTAKYIASDGAIAENPEAIKEEAVQKITDECDRAIRPLLRQYPPSEIASFPVKKILAYRWNEMDNTQKAAALDDQEFTMLACEAAAVSDIADIDAIAKRIRANALLFETHSGICFRIKRSLINQVLDSDGSRASVNEILENLVFPAAR